MSLYPDLIKTHYQDDQEDLLQMCGGVMSRLVDMDSRYKSAASELISKELIEQHKPDRNHFMIHLVGMGAHERYGPNKNADAWLAKELARKHGTFVKNAHVYREHKNKDPDTQGVGQVKYSAFDCSPGGMFRVELLTHVDISKAEDMYEMAKAAKELSFSMSAKVPHDVCSCCRKQARSRLEYCDHIKWTPLQYLPEFRKYAYVENPDPDFFDISEVGNPADRLSRYLEYRFHQGEELRKAAAAGAVILGADWAEYNGLMVPKEAAVDMLLKGEGLELLKKLAAIEAEITEVRSNQTSATSARAHLLKAAAATLESGLSQTQIDTLRSVRVGTLFHELAKRACVMPFDVFYAVVTGRPVDKQAEDEEFNKAAASLPEIFKLLMGESFDGGLPGMFTADSHNTVACDSRRNDAVQELMDVADDRFCVSPEKTKPRVMRITMTRMSEPRMALKSAATDGFAKDIAKAYGVYQMCALSDAESLGHTLGDAEYTTVVLNNREYV